MHLEGNVFATITSSGAAFANPDGCGTSATVVIQTSDTQYNQKLSTVLTAVALGKQVDFWLIGCTSTPWNVTMPVVYALSLMNQ